MIMGGIKFHGYYNQKVIYNINTEISIILISNISKNTIETN